MLDMEHFYYKTVIVLLVLTISRCQGRNKNYKPINTEFREYNDDRTIQDIRKECEKSGFLFCSFTGHIGQTSYAGCLPHNYKNICCNNPTENHNDCKSTTSETCDAERY